MRRTINTILLVLLTTQPVQAADLATVQQFVSDAITHAEAFLLINPPGLGATGGYDYSANPVPIITAAEQNDIANVDLPSLNLYYFQLLQPDITQAEIDEIHQLADDIVQEHLMLATPAQLDAKVREGLDHRIAHLQDYYNAVTELIHFFEIVYPDDYLAIGQLEQSRLVIAAHGNELNRQYDTYKLLPIRERMETCDLWFGSANEEVNRVIIEWVNEVEPAIAHRAPFDSSSVFPGLHPSPVPDGPHPDRFTTGP